jgi:hypothetical protein
MADGWGNLLMVHLPRIHGRLCVGMLTVVTQGMRSSRVLGRFFNFRHWSKLLDRFSKVRS